MKELNKMILPKEIEELAENFPVDLYIVGGKVRNFLMKIENEDIDLCSSLSLEELEKFFAGTKFELKFKNDFLQTGKIIYGEKIYDYARLRKEEYAKSGQRVPCKVEFVKDIQEDYLRRDFSINAIYYKIKTGEVFDFCKGLKDLKKRKIRCVKNPYEVLKDDGSRLLRMIRIACELKFRIERETFLAAQANVSNLSMISGAKLASEVKRICDSEFIGVNAKNAHIRGLKLLNKLKAWRFFGLNFDKLKLNMVKKDSAKYYGLFIDIINSENPASISYFLGKLLDRIELNKKKKDEFINIISGYYDALNKVPNKIYFAKYFDNFPKIHEVLLQKSKLLAQKYNFFYRYIINHKLVVKISDLKVTSKDLAKNFPSLPKKSYNIILNMVLSDIFEGKYNNDKEIILREIDRKLKFY